MRFPLPSLHRMSERGSPCHIMDVEAAFRAGLTAAALPDGPDAPFPDVEWDLHESPDSEDSEESATSPSQNN